MDAEKIISEIFNNTGVRIDRKDPILVLLAQNESFIDSALRSIPYSIEVAAYKGLERAIERINKKNGLSNLSTSSSQIVEKERVVTKEKSLLEKLEELKENTFLILIVFTFFISFVAGFLLCKLTGW